MENNKETQWNLWEVFVQTKTGAPHEHWGSVHAPDAELALQNARDVYARRQKLWSVWVVPSNAIIATKLDDNEPFFDPQDDKVYRHPLFYKIPKGVSLDVS
jgi:ring-1,2-phenylacetyl-CoA epoxidase subunit PaaB